jgi:hypothetical protein
MKKSILLTLLSLAAATFALADDKHQSYISYDDGGTIVRSGDDGKEIEAQRNLPVYPGDEVVTARRGRAEVRLSDGNILGIDRTTALLIRSVLDSYEGDANETVVELRYGKVAVQRTDLGKDHVRLDTDNASYVAEEEAVYSVEAFTRGRDRVTVFDGTIDVRTPTRSTRLRAGESATVDSTGLYDLAGDQRDAADDFERWFLKRAERFDSYNSRYVDRRLGYWTDDLDSYGTWVMVNGIGWSWRPYAAAGWRPYYHGYWHHSRGGSLTWVSYDPWGWGPYHYGRWAFADSYGWVWVPGYGYSPAWVYWMYGPSYVGWAPAGWWDCYRPYYNWAYSPYRNRDFGFGFYGRVRVSDLDLRPWTFVEPGTLISNRMDRAAMNTDLIKSRLTRTPDGIATISGGASRMTREEFRDPAEAIRRRALDGRDGKLTGRETGAPPTDLTPWIRREPEVGGNIRDRVTRGREGGGGSVAGIGGGSNNGPSRTVGGVAPIGRGGVAPIGGGSVAPIGGGSATEGRVPRGTDPAVPSTGGGSRTWRDRLGGGDRTAAQPGTPDAGTQQPSGNEGWRTRVRFGEGDGDRSATSPDRGSSSGSSGNSSDVPRRVIDRIGGARVVPREGSGSSTRDSGSRDRGSRDNGNRDSGSRDRGSSAGSRDSGSSSGGGSREAARPSPPPPSPPPSHNEGSRSESSGNRGEGGRIKRN